MLELTDHRDNGLVTTSARPVDAVTGYESLVYAGPGVERNRASDSRRYQILLRA